MFCSCILVYKYLMLKLKVQELSNWWKIYFLNYKMKPRWFATFHFMIIFLPLFLNICKTTRILSYTRPRKRTPCLLNTLFTVGINSWGDTSGRGLTSWNISFLLISLSYKVLCLFNLAKTLSTSGRLQLFFIWPLNTAVNESSFVVITVHGHGQWSTDQK